MSTTRRSLLRAVAATTAAATLATVGTTPTFAKTPSRARRRFSGDPGRGRLYYGASTDRNLAQWEHSLGHRVTVHRTFHRPDGTQSLIKAVREDLRMRRLPHVSTKCPGSWEAVAAGRYDGWLKHLRWQLGAIDRPVFLTFHHEPENDVSRPEQSGSDFVSMQTHIIDLFARRAPKVTIVPILQSWTLDPANESRQPWAWNVPAARVFGIDIYNPYSSSSRRWVSFETKLRRAHKLAGGRPIAIGEYGCRPDPSDPRRAADWMRDAFLAARDGNVVSMSYFHSGVHSPEGPYHLSGGREAVFRNRLAAPAVARLR